MCFSRNLSLSSKVLNPWSSLSHKLRRGNLAKPSYRWRYPHHLLHQTPSSILPGSVTDITVCQKPEQQPVFPFPLHPPIPRPINQPPSPQMPPPLYLWHHFSLLMPLTSSSASWLLPLQSALQTAARNCQFDHATYLLRTWVSSWQWFTRSIFQSVFPGTLTSWGSFKKGFP